MADAIVVPLGGDLDWGPFDIPGGTSPVSLVRLRSDRATRSTTVLVRFPEGWERPASGYYESSEELVMLDGVLEMSGETYRPGDWAYVPAGAIRKGTAGRPSALVFARFGGPARWVPAERAAGDEPTLRAPLEPAGTEVSSPLGAGKAWILRESELDSAWLVEPPAPGAASPTDAELLDIERRVWAWVPAGAALPRLAGLCFCRTFVPADRGGTP